MLTLFGTPNIEVKLRTSVRAKRLSLRLSQLDGRVTLTMPNGATERQADLFLAEHEGWIRITLSKMQKNGPFKPQGLDFGMQLPFEGTLYTLTQGAERGVRVLGQDILVSGLGAQLPRRLAAFLRARARDRLAAVCDNFAARLGKPYTSLSLRDTRSRWGSCTSRGRLMFSWRLIMAPKPVLDYVAAHEVAHLAHMNHSSRFWAEVGRLYPNYQIQRDWLKSNGQSLHRYSFAGQDSDSALSRER